MKMKKEFSPLLHSAAILFVLLASALFIPDVAAADSFLCNANQASNRQLAVLEKKCPIGKGMWGKKHPNNKQSYFWIQCGILDTPMPLTVAKKLYKQISTDVWMKRDGKGYRCLIGPYMNFKQVKSDLNKVKEIPKYRDSFIREVASKKSNQAKMGKAKTNPSNVEKSPAKLDLLPHSLKDVQPEVRLQTSIAGVVYQVPFLGQDTQQYYMEHDKPWSRLSYESADRICHRMGMTLPSKSDWDRLLSSKVMNDGAWPVYIPYWGANKKGLFTSGKTNQLKGDSLLNVVCVGQDVSSLAFRSP